MRISDWSSYVCSSGLEVFVAEIGKAAGIGVEVEIVDRGRELGVEVGEQRQHIAFQLGHRRDVGDALFLAEPFERAEQVAERIAKLAILVGEDRKNTRPNASH